MAIYDPENFDADILAHRKEKLNDLERSKKLLLAFTNQAMENPFWGAENTPVYA